jgi:DNA-binding LacI/PurR family transcriptional regulator
VPREGRISIKDVAREAGVSVTTVSHALNDKGRLNPETRARVREVAERLGYRPNPAARSLVSGRTGLIAVIPSLPSEPRMSFGDFGYFTELIAAATDVAVSKDWGLVVAPPLSSDFVWERVPLDGVIVIDPISGDVALPVLRERKIPFVTISADPDAPDGDAVVACEDQECTLAVLDHFAERGARRIGFLSAPPITAFLRATAGAYQDWCATHAQDPIVEILDLSELDRDPGGGMARAVERLFDRSEAPDAIYVPLEIVGVDVHRVMRDMKLRIPDDVLLATTHDRGQALTTNPPITTIEWDYREVGRRAASLLIDLVEGSRTAPCLEVVPGRLMPRASTARLTTDIRFP